MAEAAHRRRSILAAGPGPLALAALALALLLALACGGGGGDDAPEIFGGLRFVTQPDDSPAFGPVAALGAAIEVEVVDDLGVLIPDATDEVSLSLGAAPGHLILHAAGGYMADPNTTDLDTRVLELVDPTIPALRTLLAKTWGLDSPTAMTYDAATGRALLTNRAVENLYAIDPRSGASILVGDGVADWIAGLAFEIDGDERLLGAPNKNGSLQFDALYEMNPDTGVPTFIDAVLPDQGSIVFFSGLATDPTDGTLYATAAMNDEPPGSPPFDGHILLAIDAETLDATFIGDTGTKIAGLAFSPDGTLYAVTGGKATPPKSLMTVDKATGALSLLLPLGHGNDGEAIATVPPRLHGTVTATAVNGVATFDFSDPNVEPLSIDAVGSGYTLIASATGRADEESMAFDVTAATPVGLVDFDAASLDVGEADGSFDVTVELSTASETDVIVTAGVGGTASDVNDDPADTDLDYLDYFQIVIPQGDLSASRTVTIENDGDAEDDETVVFHLKDASLATGIDPAGNQTLTVTIMDDD